MRHIPKGIHGHRSSNTAEGPGRAEANRALAGVSRLLLEERDRVRISDLADTPQDRLLVHPVVLIFEGVVELWKGFGRGDLSECLGVLVTIPFRGLVVEAVVEEIESLASSVVFSELPDELVPVGAEARVLDEILENIVCLLYTSDAADE